MRTYHDKRGWALFINPSETNVLLKLILRIAEAQAFYPDFRFKFDVIDFEGEMRVLFYVPGWTGSDLVDFFNGTK